MAAQARYEAKPDPDVYYLPDHANNTIPEDIRCQFQTDAFGRVMFFTAPPVDTEKKVKLHHTAKYLAWKAKREELLKEKRKRDAEAKIAGAKEAKRAKSEEAKAFGEGLQKAKEVALEKMNKVLAEETVAQYKVMYGEKWREALDLELKTLERLQDAAVMQGKGRSAIEGDWDTRERKEIAVRGLTSSLEFGVKQ